MLFRLTSCKFYVNLFLRQNLLQKLKIFIRAFSGRPIHLYI